MTMALVSKRLLLALVVGDLDLAGRGDAGRALNRVDLVLLQQELDAVDIAFNTGVLEGEHGGKVESRLHLDAHLAETVRRFREALARMQQCLGGDAADIEAGAAMGGALLDHRDLHAKLRRADRADIAAGPRADDDKVVTHIGSLSPLLLRSQRLLAVPAVPKPRQAAVIGKRIDHWRGATPVYGQKVVSEAAGAIIFRAVDLPAQPEPSPSLMMVTVPS